MEEKYKERANKYGNYDQNFNSSTGDLITSS